MIYFQADEVAMPMLRQDLVRDWIQSVAAYYGKRVGNIHYIFCSDERILEVNRQFLQHDYYTDVITFDYSEGTVLSGDIFISMETVGSNAEQQQTTFEQELLRIIIHGVLHLTGQGDKTPEAHQEMTEKEEHALILYAKICQKSN
ncbi:MAG TPA: rRNA maturation RNase YbeY [Bacteroidales bacterium]|nr:rRNA maturation RNase YbeY [Bacteroidales bacterium]